MNVLFLTSRLPFPPVGGDRVRTFQFITQLSRHNRVTIVSLVEHEEEAKAAEAYRHLYHRLITVPLPKWRSYLNCLKGLAFGTDPLQVLYYASPRMRAVVAEEIATQSYGAVSCYMIRVMPYLDDIHGVRKVADFCDALSLYHRRGARLAPRFSLARLVHTVEAKRVAAYEIATIEKVDVSVFISPVDVEHCRRSTNRGRLEVVKNGVDVHAFPFYDGRRDDDRIVYMGNMRTFQNTDAVSYFVEKILPLVRKERPDATLYIVGNEPSKRVRSLHDGKTVFVTGRVDSVIPYLTNAAVVVAPMRAVAGVQNKILESLAVGTPVVTTSIGAEGLEPSIMEIADTPQEFARATIALMRDPALRRERAVAARAYVEAHCTWEKAMSNLDSLLVVSPAEKKQDLPSTPASAAHGTSSSR